MEITKKEIKRQILDEDTMILSLDMERKRLDIGGELITEYVLPTNEDRVEHPHIVLRDVPEANKYTETIDKILPDDDHVIWTNPRKTIKALLAEILVEYII